MSDTQRALAGYQKILPAWKFAETASFSEKFAQDRFLKKMEVPSVDNNDLLARMCWESWHQFDAGLPKRLTRPNGHWYKVRERLSGLRTADFSELQFPKGSEFSPTRGENSVEARLCTGQWNVTHDSFGIFAKAVHSNKALKRAFRRRYAEWYDAKQFDISRSLSDRMVFSRLGSYGAFEWKLARIVNFVHGARFATVPKNNEKRRPINVEPFGNIMLQRSIGIHLREYLRSSFGVDLQGLQQVHRNRIADPNVATIDLQNASDSVSLALCEFVLPRRLFQQLMQVRSSMVLGPDGNYHVTRKISSMGNGFTFELMTVVLTALVRTFDPSGSVYGDDIIIAKDKAQQLIDALTDVGFVVNESKSFVSGPFRESCGGNFHDDEGYIESYDFTYPQTIYDCVTTCNKAFRLSLKYPSFELLYQELVRLLPIALHGGPCREFEVADLLSLRALSPDGFSGETFFDCPPFFVTTKRVSKQRVVPDSILGERLESLSYDPDGFYIIKGFKPKMKKRSPTVRDLTFQWAKYEMYLYSGRVCDDHISGSVEWKMETLISNGQFFVKAIHLIG